MRLQTYLKIIETVYICDALDESDGCTSLAARLLGIGRTTLIEKMKRLGVNKDDYKKLSILSKSSNRREVKDKKDHIVRNYDIATRRHRNKIYPIPHKEPWTQMAEERKHHFSTF